MIINGVDKPILDVCCGGRQFYFDKNNPLVLFADIRAGIQTFFENGNTRYLEVQPDVIHDFKNLPYEDESFKVVVFDPPHLKRCGETGWIWKKYGKLDRDWKTQLSKGFAECFRVLEKHGVLIFKWNETQIKVSEILSLTPEIPVLGHKSGKAMKTHWILFIKN